MAFEFRSFEHFKQVRAKAAQWRAFNKQLRGANGEELIRGVLQEPVIDNRTDRDYEKRLYEGFKEGMRRLHEGVPLTDKEPPKSPPKDQFREACITLGYLPPSSHAPLPSSPSTSLPSSSSTLLLSSSSTPPSSSSSALLPPSPSVQLPPSPSALLPPSPSALPLTYPRVLFLHTPSPPSSPSSMTSSVALLRATPTSPPPVKTPTRIFSPNLSTAPWSPTPPPTPRELQHPAYPDHSSSEEDTWLPSTPSPMRRELEAASFRPAIAEETEKTQNDAPAAPEVATEAATEAAKKKPTTKQKRRKQQPKFSDEALKKVRPSPPATRRSKAQYK